MKKFKLLLSIIIISICGYTFFKVINSNIIDKKINYQIQNTNSRLEDIDTINNISNDDFSVLVVSPNYNAVVSLDENAKEFKVSLLEDVSEFTKNSTSHYINFTEDNIYYLTKNKDTLINKFKNSSIFDKYNMITDMLKSYDTNIDSSDLIELTLKFYNK